MGLHIHAPVHISFPCFPGLAAYSDFYYSMFKYFKSGLNWIGPEFVGFDNFVAIFDMSKGSNILALTWNTLIMWVLGFVPQIIISLLFCLLVYKCKTSFKMSWILQNCNVYA